MVGALASVPVLLALAAPIWQGRPSEAASPGSGTISTGATSLSWTGKTFTAATPVPDVCPASVDAANVLCDHFQLTVNVPASFYLGPQGGVEVSIAWPDNSNDFDLYIYDSNGNEVAHSAQGGTTSEQALVPLASGTYEVRVVPFTVINANYTGTATLTQGTTVTTTNATFNTSAQLAFGPATVVSAHFLGAEPQMSLERRIPGSQPGAIDPNRIFVDWPLSSRTQTGQLLRSTDGGETFRLLFDPTCAERNRPNCLTGGGGDTVNRVNLFDGSVYFVDQEEVVNEGLSSSTDHGDAFPAARQFALTNEVTAVDRQWVAPADDGTVAIGPRKVKAFLAYHLPGAGEYIQGIDQDGLPIPQPAPQLTLVSQSGPTRYDFSEGPGRGWLYQPYRDGGGYKVATAFGPNYQDPLSWTVNSITTDQPAIFPWLNLDNHGNAYATWVTGGVVYYSYSRIDDPQNDPQRGGTPGTVWSDKIRVSLPTVGSAVFPEVAAGDAGRIAIAYDGTTDYAGASDNAPDTAVWNTYAAVVTNALGENGLPEITTGVVNHRPIHIGSICTSGTTCTGDRSLLDMIDVGFDQDGRVAVVFTDNNSTFQMPNGPSGTRLGPFVHFAKEVSGPSLLAAKPTVRARVPGASVKDAAGDATWPNTASGVNLPSLDLLGASLSVERGDVVARMPLADASVAGMVRDLAAYNRAFTTTPPAARLQYVLRFSTGTDIYHLSMESTTDGSRRFFGGKLDASDQMTNGTSALGATYHADPQLFVSGSVEDNTLVLRVKASDLGFSGTVPVYSVTAFSMAGPGEPDDGVISLLNPEEEDSLIVNPMRTVDATQPFDAKLALRIIPTPTPTASPTLTASATARPSATPTPLTNAATTVAVVPTTIIATVAGGPAGTVVPPVETAAGGIVATVTGLLPTVTPPVSLPPAGLP